MKAVHRTVEDEVSIIEPPSGARLTADTFIAQRAPHTLLGAAVKLRRLADEVAAAGGEEDDLTWECCRQVLALVERSNESMPRRPEPGAFGAISTTPALPPKDKRAR